MSKIILISCVSKKLSHSAKARDLYVSPLFKMNMIYASSLQANKIFILSAKYGLVDIEQELEPYEQTLNTMSVREIKLWAEKVKGQMEGKIDFINDEIIFLAGEKYRRYLIPLLNNTNVPLKGLTIGKQLQYLKRITSMQNDCEKLHVLVKNLRVFKFPFNEKSIPSNGLYILFEKGEIGHGGNRIVRIGTHTGINNLMPRLKEHFITENKDRSIFRKNIGRCILNKADDPFLKQWDLDLTSRTSKDRHLALIDFEKQKGVERAVTNYIHENFSFVVLQIDNQENRLNYKSQIISTVSLCENCNPSRKWLGHFSPKAKIRESGLWQEKELYKQPLSEEDFEIIEEFARKG